MQMSWHWLAGHKRSGYPNGVNDHHNGQPNLVNGTLAQWMTALAHKDETVRLNAAYALGTHGEASVPQLIDALRGGGRGFCRLHHHADARQYSWRQSGHLCRGPCPCSRRSACSWPADRASGPRALVRAHNGRRTRWANIGLPATAAVPGLTQQFAG